MTNKRILFIAVVFLALFLLHQSNPTIDDFHAYIDKRIASAADDYTDALKSFFFGLTDPNRLEAAKRGAIRKNRYFWSVFEIEDVPGEHAFKITGLARKIFINTGGVTRPAPIPIY